MSTDQPARMRPRRGLRLVLAVAIVVTAGACWWQTSERVRPNVVLILIDTLRKDHVGTYGYERDTTPTIDALARDGLVFENAIAQSSWTLPSLGSMFTSSYATHLVARAHSDEEAPVFPALAGDALTLAEILVDSGYATVSIATNNYNLDAFNLMQGFQTRRLQLAAADWVIDAAIEAVGSHLETGDAGLRQPLFLYLHLMDVHLHTTPPPPAYASMFATDDPELARYDRGLRFIDDEIGRFVGYIESTGMYEDTVFVIVSDHGEDFGDHAEVARRLGLHSQRGPNVYGEGHGHTLFPELLEVPLIFHGRGIRRGRVSQQVRLVDLAPAILALVGAGHAEFQPAGVDVVGSWYRSALEDLPAVSETTTRAAKQQSIQDRDYQYLLLDGRELLIDKRRPGIVDIASSRPEVCGRLAYQLDEILEASPAAKTVDTPILEQIAERLRALGYVE